MGGRINREWQLAFFKDLKERFIQCERRVSIIIQGPLHHRSISTIPDYLKQGEVIVSCWETDNLSLLDEYKNDVKIVVNKYSDTTNCWKQGGSQAPWIYQHHTTLNGLLLAKNHFSIKIRSDEAYPTLTPLINKLIFQNENRCPKTGNFENKFITSNIYFRFDREAKFHPSDHIVAGKTRRMREVFEKARFLASRRPIERFPEQLLCRAVIESKWNKKLKRFERQRLEDSINQMKEYFEIIKISDLPKHIWTSSYRKYDPLYNEEDWCHDINTL
jgi:hypothetical protein